MNAISPRRLEARLHPPLRIEMGRWLPDLAASQRRMAARPDELFGSICGFIARATENEMAASALLRGDTVASILERIHALRGDRLSGGQLCGILEMIQEQEAGTRPSAR